MKLYYGTYGHHLSGKLYVYWGGDNFRTGQQVVAPVTNKRSGKTYNTMFTIARTQSEKNAQPEVERLEGAGITIKSLGGTDVLTLPGGKEFGTKKAWKTESEKRYRKAHNLPPLPEEEKKVKESKKEKLRIRLQNLGSTMIRDSETQKAKNALLSRKKAKGNSLKQKDRLKKMVQREAFITDSQPKSNNWNIQNTKLKKMRKR